MPRKPCLPASSHTPRSTILSFSHWSWNGATWRSRKDRYDSRNSSCSGSNSVRSYFTALPTGTSGLGNLPPKIYQPDGWFVGARARPRVGIVAETIRVQEQGRVIEFTFDDLMRYHGPGSPGGVANAFKVLQR